MKKQRKFLVGGGVVAGLVGYLMVTGMQDSMVYYYTPTELHAKATDDPSFAEVGVKAGGRVAPGSVEYDQRTLDLRFLLIDIEQPETSFPVHYQGPLPDTFQEGGDVVVEGRYTADGGFEATVLLTKCGSRYEAGAEAYEA